MKRLIMLGVVFVLIADFAMPIIDVEAQDINEPIPECNAEQWIQVTETIPYMVRYLDIVDEANTADDITPSIESLNTLQHEWWEEVVPELPYCTASIEFTRLFGRLLDEFLISLLFIESGDIDRAQGHLDAMEKIHDPFASEYAEQFQAAQDSLSASGSEVTITATKNVNLRGGPGTDFEIAGTLTTGDTAAAIGRNNAGDWLLLESGAWVASWVVTVEGDINSLPIEQPTAQP